jgi:CO dehydrogenase nickel-insertion accessory protein CooC1
MKLFKRKKTLTKSAELKVCIINEDNDNDLHEAFGITTERKETLGKLTKAAWLNNPNVSKAAEEIVKQCVHVNEVIVCSMILDRYNSTKVNYLEQLFLNLDQAPD